MREQYEAVLTHREAILAAMKKHGVAELAITAVSPHMNNLRFVITKPKDASWDAWVDLNDAIVESMGETSFLVSTVSENARCYIPPCLGVEQQTLDKGGRLPIARLTADTTETDLRAALEPVSNYNPDDESTYACNLKLAAAQEPPVKQPAADPQSRSFLVTSPASFTPPPGTPAVTSPVSPLNDSLPRIAAN